MLLKSIFYIGLMCVILSCSKELEEKPIEGWGANLEGNLNFPKNLKNIKKVSISYSHTLALFEDGTVFAWGENRYYQTNVPTDLNEVVDIDASSTASAALKSDGNLVMWGSNDLDDIPSEYRTEIVDIAVSGNYIAVLKRDGSVHVWGSSIDGYFMQVPFQDKEKISIERGGRSTLLVLYKDKTAESYEVFEDRFEDVTVDLSDITAISSGLNHNLALKANGTVVAWGWNDLNQTDVPEDLDEVVAIGGGEDYSMALKKDGSIVIWGYPHFETSNIPKRATNVKGLAVGTYDFMIFR